MKISVITVSFNSEKTIKDTILSVASQNYNDIEYIIIDGGSTDNTLDIINKFGNNIVDKLISEPDNGIYYAMNKGLSIATGDVVGFLNSDDFYFNNNIITNVANEMSIPSVDACYGDLIYVDKENCNRIIRFWKSQNYSTGLCMKGWMPAHPTFYVKKLIYDKYGNFDTSFRLQSDFEMAFRLFEINKIKSVYLPILMVTMRVGGASNSSFKNIISGNIEAINACKKNGFNAGFIFLLRKFLYRIPQFFIRP